MNAENIAAALAGVRSLAGPGVTVVAATKYVTVEDMAILVEAGVEVVGENRAQDLQRKHAVYADAFHWHFIGHLQSNKVNVVNRICELVHSLDSDSTARRLEIPAFLEVNLGRETSKSGVDEDEIAGYLDRYPFIRGLMTMPPFATDPQASRAPFRRLAELARHHGLTELSMGTSQDWQIAVEEGATHIRLGSTLFR